jgi:hypothetical protein
VSRPQVIDDQEHERIYERVAAVDVAKDTGMVCTRTPHPARPGSLAGGPARGPCPPFRASPGWSARSASRPTSWTHSSSMPRPSSSSDQPLPGPSARAAARTESRGQRSAHLDPPIAQGARDQRLTIMGVASECGQPGVEADHPGDALIGVVAPLKGVGGLEYCVAVGQAAQHADGVVEFVGWDAWLTVPVVIAAAGRHAEGLVLLWWQRPAGSVPGQAVYLQVGRSCRAVGGNSGDGCCGP